MRKGIAVAGNLIVDHVKITDIWPARGMLCNIEKEYRCIGGCAGNTAAGLAIMDSSIPLSCYGRTGTDEDGEFIRSQLKKLGVPVEDIQYSPEESTSYTDVMSVKATGERTFFHRRGANKEFVLSEEEIACMEASILHIGYALLLDAMDASEEVYGSVMAKTLAMAQKRGIQTSMDVASEEGGRFGQVVAPCLKYCDYFIANEIEGGNITDITPRDGQGNIDKEKIKEILLRLHRMGVGTLAVIHAPEWGYALDCQGNYWEAPGYCLPEGFIKGSVGAGDAFCAGMLYALYQEYPVKEALQFANLSAVCSLTAEDSISGMRRLAEMERLGIELAKGISEIAQRHRP